MLLNQEGDNYEILIINDGSKDDTEKFIQPYLKNEKVRYYYVEKNCGVSAARNLGIKLAYGKMIVFVDVDDEIMPGYITSISREMHANPLYDIICFARYYVKDHNRNNDISNVANQDVFLTALGAGKIPYSKDYLLSFVWSKAFRKQFLLDHNLTFNESISLSEDEIFMLHAYILYKQIKFVHNGYYRYVQNADSVLHSGEKEEEKEGYKKFVQELLAIVDNIPEIWNREEIRNLSNKRIFEGGMITIGRVCRAMQMKCIEARVDTVKELAQYATESCVVRTKQWTYKYEFNKTKFKIRIIYHFPKLYIIFLYCSNLRRTKR